jgi:DNA polymerase
VSTHTQLLALHEELRRLKAGGLRAVAVSEEALTQLRTAVSAAEDETPAPARAVAEPAPEEPTARRAPAPVRPSSSPGGGAPLPAEAPVVTLPPGDKATQWAALRELVLGNPVCRAHVRPGKKVVLGVGSLDATIFFCGEAPGAEEEEQGEPFVGPAGQLLTRMIQAMGLQREQVYIGNIMNWRPELPTGAGGVQFGNRPPTPEEMRFCLPFLRAQLAIVQPKVIVALGKTAAEGLLGFGSFKALGEVRGRWHAFAGVPLMVTYHPSYILRNSSNHSKRQIWEDLLKVMEKVGLPISDKQRRYFL